MAQKTLGRTQNLGLYLIQLSFLTRHQVGRWFVLSGITLLRASYPQSLSLGKNLPEGRHQQTGLSGVAFLGFVREVGQ